MEDEEKRKEERVIQWLGGLLVSGQKTLQGEKKPSTTGKKTHAISGCVERKMEAKPAG